MITQTIDNWRFSYAENRRVNAENISPKTSEEATAIFDSFPAVVPGNFELDLMREKLLPDLYYGTNALLAQKLENLHLYYYTKFSYARDIDTDDFLVFGGIDTFADIYIDGNKIGFTENMLHSHEFSLKFLENGEHDLFVHIYPAAIYARRFYLPAMCFGMKYNSDSLSVRKAPYMFGWDIMPRIVSGGLWKSVKIEKRNRSRIDKPFTYTEKVVDGVATLKTALTIVSDEDYISDFRVKVIASFDGKVCAETEQRCFSANQRIGLQIQNAKLWYPRNYGEPNLYTVNVVLMKNGEKVDEAEYRIGIRTVKLLRTSCSGDEGEFCFEINGDKVFCLGTNWVPTDAFPSRHKEYDRRALELVRDVGCNMIRCWGGNVYPSQEVYDFCDENGIMIWQDFSFGCGHYPDDERICALTKIEVRQIVFSYRNHPSLVLWAGDNECDSFVSSSRRIDPNENMLTRSVIFRELRNHDATRPYLPSSPYLDKLAYEFGKPSEDHVWGPRDYFKGDFYKNAVCHFASEIGYHGCNSPESLRKFISDDSLDDMGTSKGCKNSEWLVHAAGMETATKEEGNPYAYRIALMISQVERLFTERHKDIREFAMQSQISQAEADKYFIERFRMEKWRKTGIIWWNMIDGWPQISDAVVDWYGCKKLAFYYIKRSQQPFAMMIDEPKNGRMNLYAVNDLRKDLKGNYVITDLSVDKKVAEGEFEIRANSSEVVTCLSETDHAFYLIEWVTEEGKGKNHYVCSLGDKWRFEKYVENLKKADMYSDFEGF